MNKLKKVSMAEAVNEVPEINKIFSSLWICLKPETDFPHPRHLCFTYPFGKSSPQRFCCKCYCYVCEEVAPCKMWWNPLERHCEATDKDYKWRLVRKLKNILPHPTTMVYHKLTISIFFNKPGKQPFGTAGGLICNKDGDWIVGFGTCHLIYVDDSDYLYFIYVALLEGLKLAWSRGYRYIKVYLGYVFHDGFWHDFYKDDSTGKFRLYDLIPIIDPRNIVSLIAVKDYLNREWFLDFENTKSFKEESGAHTIAGFAAVDGQQAYNVYDFRNHPKAGKLMDMAKDMVKHPDQYGINVYDDAEAKEYLGLN